MHSSFQFLIKIKFQDERRASLGVLRGLKEELRQENAAFSKWEKHQLDIYNRLKASAATYHREILKIRDSLSKMNPASQSASVVRAQLADLLARRAAVEQHLFSTGANILAGRGQHAANVAGIQDSISAVTSHMAGLDNILSKISTGNVVVKFIYELVKLEAIFATVGGVINTFGSQIGTAFQLMGIKMMMPFMEVFADMEQKLIPLQKLTGSSRGFLKGQVQELANLPALDFMSASQAILDLVVSDPLRDVGKATKQLKTIANAVFMSGGGPERVDLVTLALKQMRAKGVIQGEEVTKQLSPNIPGIFQFMKDTFGTADTRALKAAGVGPEQFIDKLIPWLDSHYPKLPDSPKTWLENLADRMTYAKGEIGGGFFNMAQEGLKGIIEAVDELVKSGALKEIGAALARLFGLFDKEGTKKGIVELVAGITTFIDMLNAFKERIIALIQSVGAILHTLSKLGIFGGVGSIIASFFDNFADHMKRTMAEMEMKMGPSSYEQKTLDAMTMDDVRKELAEKLAARNQIINEQIKLGSRFGDEAQWMSKEDKEKATALAHKRADLTKDINDLVAQREKLKEAEIGKKKAEDAAKDAEAAGAFPNWKELLRKFEMEQEYKPKGEDIILGGNNAQRVLTPLDYAQQMSKPKPTITVKVDSVSAFADSIQEMIYDTVRQMADQGVLQGAR